MITDNERTLKDIIGMFADELEDWAEDWADVGTGIIEEILDSQPADQHGKCLLDFCVWCRENGEPPSRYIKWESEMSCAHDEELGGRLCLACWSEAEKEQRKRDMEEARADEMIEYEKERRREQHGA